MSYQTTEVWRKANKPVLMFKIRPAVFLLWMVFIFILNWWVFWGILAVTILFAVAGYFAIPPMMVCRYLHNRLLGARRIYRLWWKR